jgi:hypothetical protein
MTLPSGTIVVIVDGGFEMVLARLDGRPPDLALLDALARLQLAARRCGRSIRLRGPCPELCELLELVGLTDVIEAAPTSGGEAVGQADGGEQLGVEEVVQPRDPSA